MIDQREGCDRDHEQLRPIHDRLSENCLRWSKLRVSVTQHPHVLQFHICKECSYKSPLCPSSDHAAELGNAVPTKPLIFMKPPSSFIQAGQNIEVTLRALATTSRQETLHQPLIFVDPPGMRGDSPRSRARRGDRPAGKQGRESTRRILA